MVEGTEAPTPSASGSDGSQTQEDASRTQLEVRPPALPMAQAIRGLAASNAWAFGGEVASTLIAGATSQMAIELQQTKEDLASIREKNEELAHSVSTAQTEKAVLVERIDAYRANLHLRNFGIAAGTILFGVGVHLIRDSSVGLGIGSLSIGILLLILGWYAAPKGGDR